MGSGHQSDRGYYHVLNFRLALHDLADASSGYPEHAQIEFLPGTLRYFIDTPRLRLDELSFARVRSLTPISRFEKSMSWMVDLGMRRTYDAGCRDCATGFGQVGGGFAVSPFGKWLTMYALANVALDAPVHTGLLSAIRAGIGPWGGLRVRFAENVTLLALGSYTYLPAQTQRQIYGLDGALRIGYLRNFALGLEGRVYPTMKAVQGVSYIYF